MALCAQFPAASCGTVGRSANSQPREALQPCSLILPKVPSLLLSTCKCLSHCRGAQLPNSPLPGTGTRLSILKGASLSSQWGPRKEGAGRISTHHQKQECAPRRGDQGEMRLLAGLQKAPSTPAPSSFPHRPSRPQERAASNAQARGQGSEVRPSAPHVPPPFGYCPASRPSVPKPREHDPALANTGWSP